MKPRHTAEQSTVHINKAQKIGKKGFAAVVSVSTTPQKEMSPAPITAAASVAVCPIDPQERLQCDSCQ
jgi:ribonucleoside-diphosphate reductase alpha chain